MKRFADGRTTIMGLVAVLAASLPAVEAAAQVGPGSSPATRADPRPLPPDQRDSPAGRADRQASVFLDATTFARSGNRLLGGRVVGGLPAPIGAYPWLVSIGTAGTPPSVGHFCGGTLISREWVVTAAHCLNDVRSADLLQIKYGSNSLGAGGTVVRVAAMKRHPQWNSATFENDLALLKLASAVTDATPITILSPADAGRLFPDGVLAFVAGWGRTSEGGDLPDELRHVGVQLVSNEVCGKPQSYPGQIVATMACAGFIEGGKDSCQGDSGGPLMVSDRRGSYVLAGVVSWGEGCARPAKYGVYTRSSTFNDWIAREAR